MSKTPKYDKLISSPWDIEIGDWMFLVKELEEQNFDLAAKFKQEKESHDQDLERDHKAIIEWKSRVDSAQAKIDRLMFEFCPDEITDEQFRRWQEHQRPVSKEETQAIDAAAKRK